MWGIALVRYLGRGGVLSWQRLLLASIVTTFTGIVTQNVGSGSGLFCVGDVRKASVVCKVCEGGEEGEVNSDYSDYALCVEGACR